MTASLMAYALLAGLLVAGAGRAVEELVWMLRKPTRLVWLGALGGLVALTATAPMRRLSQEPAFAVQPAMSEGFLSTAGLPIPQQTAPASVLKPSQLWSQINISSGAALRRPFRYAESAISPDVDRGLTSLWLLLSASVLAVGLAAHAHFSVKRRRWPRRRLDETWVRVAPRTGPAVIGLVSPEIVIPRWLEAEPVETRRLVLLHEKEHVRGRDTLTLAAGCLGVALLPWNPVAWWMLHRLRLAVELDCDRRVLRHGVQPGQYGTMLIGLSARDSGLLLGHPALASFPSALERRLLAMTARASNRRWLRAAGMALLAATAVIAACKTHLPAAVGETDSVRAEPAAASAPGRTTDEVGSLADPGATAGVARTGARSPDLAPVEVRGRAVPAPGAVRSTDLTPVEVRGRAIAAPAPVRSTDITAVEVRGRAIAVPATVPPTELTEVEVRGRAIAPRATVRSTDLTAVEVRGRAIAVPATVRPTELTEVEVRGRAIAPRATVRSTDLSAVEVRGRAIAVPATVRPTDLTEVEVPGRAIAPRAPARSTDLNAVEVRGGAIAVPATVRPTDLTEVEVRGRAIAPRAPARSTDLNAVEVRGGAIAVPATVRPTDLTEVEVRGRAIAPAAARSIDGQITPGQISPTVYVIDGILGTKPPPPGTVIRSIVVHKASEALVGRFGDRQAAGGVVEITTEMAAP